MTKKELREFIRSIVHEQLGDMASTGLTSNDGNNVTSQRPFVGDADEMSFYTNTGAPYGGAEGQHTRGMEPAQGIGNPNSQKHVKF